MLNGCKMVQVTSNSRRLKSIFEPLRSAREKLSNILAIVFLFSWISAESQLQYACQLRIAELVEPPSSEICGARAAKTTLAQPYGYASCSPPCLVFALHFILIPLSFMVSDVLLISILFLLIFSSVFACANANHRGRKIDAGQRGWVHHHQHQPPHTGATVARTKCTHRTESHVSICLLLANGCTSERIKETFT